MEQVNETAPQPSGAGQFSIEARVSDLVRLGIIGLFAYWTLELIPSADSSRMANAVNCLETDAE